MQNAPRAPRLPSSLKPGRTLRYAAERFLVGQLPGMVPAARVARAALALIQRDNDAAVAALLRADELGAVGLKEMLARPEWSALAGDARLAGLSDRASPEPAPVTPALVEQGRAPVGPANTGWDPSLARLIAYFRFPPILGTHAFAEKLAPDDPLAELQRLVARGRAAGNVGDLYDTRGQLSTRNVFVVESEWDCGP